MALSQTTSYFDLKEDPEFKNTLKRSQLRRVGPNTTDLWTYQYAPLWIDSSPRSLPYANEVIGPRTLNTQEQRVEQVNTWVDISAAEKRAKILGIAKGQIPDWTPKELIKDPFREIDLTEGAARWHTMETALAATDDADLDAFDTNLDNHIPDPGVVQRHIIDTGENDGWAVGSIQMSILATPPGPLWRLADGSDCTGTAYATATGDNKLPDLRGAYLRMAGRNASHASWDGDVLGTFQADSTAMPNIPFHIVNDGDHKHSLNMTAVANPNSKIHYKDWTRITAGLHTAESPGNSYGSYWTAAHSDAVQSEGDHSHHFDGGDAETRPKTYSVNYFIKVDSVITPALTSDKQPSLSTQQPAPGANPLNRWPKGSLKHLLDSMGIAYPADATIADLVALVPDTHQHHLAEEIPTPTWTNTRIVQWLEKEGADVPDALKDDTNALFEMVHDLIELKAGIPLDPGFVTPLPKNQWPTPPNLDRTSHNQLAAWMSVSLYPVADAHSVRPLLEACTKAELAAMLEGTRPLPDTSHLPAANS